MGSGEFEQADLGRYSTFVKVALEDIIFSQLIYLMGQIGYPSWFLWIKGKRMLIKIVLMDLSSLDQTWCPNSDGISRTQVWKKEQKQLMLLVLWLLWLVVYIFRELVETHKVVNLVPLSHRCLLLSWWSNHSERGELCKQFSSRCKKINVKTVTTITKNNGKNDWLSKALLEAG